MILFICEAIKIRKKNTIRNILNTLQNIYFNINKFF